MSFIQIVEDSAPFPWTPEAEDGTPMESVLTLQVLSEDVLMALRKKHTHSAFKHGQRVEDFDSFAFAADVVDKAVVGWEGVFRAGQDARLPCDRRYKLALPERLKVEVMRLCAGKEAGRLFEVPDGDGTDPKASLPNTSPGK